MSESAKAVFLSYAREDTDAARRIAEALRSAGIEVWFDQSELRGGDKWDAKIRKQINECALFLPVVSQHTQERGKGYFRLEWKLAVEQTHLMADGMAFLAPIVVDHTPESGALVPAEFMRVQWTRLPGALPTPQFVEQMKRLLNFSDKAAAVSSRNADAPHHVAPRKSNLPLTLIGVVAAGAIGAAIYFALKTPAPAAAIPPPPARAEFATKAASTPAVSDKSAPAAKSIAVLPFINLGADKADEYLGDGMTEELLNVLAKVKGLRVPGRSSSFAFKGRTDEDIFRRVGETLHVSTVLEGSVRKSGNRVRITAQLINVADGYHLWSETYDRDVTDILGLQTEVARQVVQALQVQLGLDEVRALEKKATTNPAAHALYLKGRFHHYQFTETDEKLAIDCFKQALALDPDYAMAHAGMAAVYAELSSSYLSPAEAMPIAKSYVTKALALDDSLAEAHHSLALVRWWGDWDFSGAETEFKRSLELNPNDATTHAEYAGFLSQRGRFAEAHAAADRSLALDPQSDVARASIFINQRRYEEAVAEVRQQLARQSSSDTARLRYLLANVYVLQGKLREAVSEARLARAASAKPGASDAFLAIVLASAGEKAEARAMVEGILQMAKERYISPVWIARLYAALGETDHAFEWLQTAYDTRSDHLLHLNISPYYDNLRADPRFQALLKKIGLVQ